MNSKRFIDLYKEILEEACSPNNSTEIAETENITLNSKEYAALQNWAKENKITFIDHTPTVGYYNWAAGATHGSTHKTFAADQAKRDGWKVLKNLAALVAAWKA